MNWKFATISLVTLLFVTVAALLYFALNPRDTLLSAVPPPAAAVVEPDLQVPVPVPDDQQPAEVSVPEPVSAPESTQEVGSSWDDRLGVALTEEGIDLRDRSKVLLGMVNEPNATVEQRLEALNHGLNLVEDENYWEDALPLGLQNDLPEEVSEMIFADLHNRDLKLLKGFCDEVVKLENHPLQEQAQGVKEFINISSSTDSIAEGGN